MKFRLVIALFCAIFSCVISHAVGVLPQFSNDSEEHWYYIRFSSGGATLAFISYSSPVTTETCDANKDSQLWKFVGSSTECAIQNKSGAWLIYNNGLYFVADETQKGSFIINPSGCELTPDSWELSISSMSGEKSFGMLYGIGAGKNIGWASSGSVECAVDFVSQADLSVSNNYSQPEEFKILPDATYTPSERRTLWYRLPASSRTYADKWMEYSLPIGNGQFGAMIQGGIGTDKIQFNDKTLWSGTTTVRGSYLNFGELYIDDTSNTFGYTDDKAVKDYILTLDMPNGEVTATYRSPDGVTEYKRQYIASYPDDVVAVHITASVPGKISVNVRLMNGVCKGAISPVYEGNNVSFEGLIGQENFKAQACVVPTGGKVITHEDYIEVDGADELMIVLAGNTNYDIHSNNFLSDVTSMKAQVESRVANAASKRWDVLYKTHIDDFKPLMDRSQLILTKGKHVRPVDEMVDFMAKFATPYPSPNNLMLEELYYTFGRYLMLSSSRGIDLPSNLQGIWNNSNSPSWECDIHSNINVQMNYWPAECTNLSELHMPFLNYIYTMVTEHDQWQEYALRSGQSKGWTLYTQNNIFGLSDYAENYVIANAWFATHMWQHYLYTMDKEFLATKAMPVMMSCAEYWLERLVKDSDDTWVAPNEWSPEHGPGAENGVAHAQQILAYFFKACLNAIEVLGDNEGLEDSFVSNLRDKYEHLDKGLSIETYNGAWGASCNDIASGTPILREWKYSNYAAGENGHRHQSHLMALYPFDDITPGSPYFEPAVNSLQLRSDISTGWSLAWRIALWARAGNGEHAHKIIKSALRHATSYAQSNSSGGIYYNLLDSHAPFQIDGNFGFTAGVTEMLLQSNGGILRILPGLSPVWTEGSVRGLKGEGNFEVDIKWQDKKMETATIISHSGVDCCVKYPGLNKGTITCDDDTDLSLEWKDDDTVKFPTVAGKKYYINMTSGAGVDNVVVDEADEDAPVVYYNLQGVRVENPANGLYIKVQGKKATKVLMR